MAVLLVVGLDLLPRLVWSRSGMDCCMGLDTVFISTVIADSLLLLTSPQSLLLLLCINEDPKYSSFLAAIYFTNICMTTKMS